MQKCKTHKCQPLLNIFYMFSANKSISIFTQSGNYCKINKWRGFLFALLFLLMISSVKQVATRISRFFGIYFLGPLEEEYWGWQDVLGKLLADNCGGGKKFLCAKKWRFYGFDIDLILHQTSALDWFNHSTKIHTTCVRARKNKHAKLATRQPCRIISYLSCNCIELVTMGE